MMASAAGENINKPAIENDLTEDKNTESDLEIEPSSTADEETKPAVDDEQSKKFYNNRSNILAYAVLGTLLLLRITFQWQRKSFNYIYGFKGDGLQAANPAYEILTAYPALEQYYGFLVGFAYTVPISICGLFVSLLPPGFNRKIALATVAIIAGLSMSVTGTVNSLIVLTLMRVVHAACASFINPLEFSLVAEYFPKDRRATANAVLQSANVFGIALSSMSILVIQRYGWRQLYAIMGGLGIVLGTVAMLVIKEPRSKDEDPNTRLKMKVGKI